MNFRIRQVVNPSKDEIVQISEAAVAAFEGDIFVDVATAGDPALSAPYHRAQITAASRAGKIFVAEDQDNDNLIVAVSTWYPPGVGLFGNNNEDIQPFLEICPRSLQKWWTEEFLPEYPKASQNFFGLEQLRKTWHLQLLATRPEYQRKGVGYSLVAHGRDIFFGEGMSLYLETQKEDNITFYGRLGFVVKGTQIFEAANKSFPLFCMIAHPSG